MKNLRKIMIVAGEVSGDLHAAKLVAALRESAPGDEFRFFGSAGPKMREEGVEPVVNADGLSVVGLPEIARSLPMFIRTFRKLKKAAFKYRPDVVILVDFPDFNLKLAKSLSRKGFRIVYYISPQLWAWRKYRLRTIRRYVDLLISILPFEKDWYAERGVSHVEYVGSPLAREVYPTEARPQFLARHGLDPERPIAALLPGSRHKEIVRILPVMLEAARRIAEVRPEVQFVAALASGANREDAESVMRNTRVALPPIKIIENETFNLLAAADVAAVTSGTATLETGIIGTPMAIVYKTSSLNYSLLRPLISVDHFGLINLIADDRVAAELIQKDFTAETLRDELLRLLDPDENKAARERLKAASERLGHGGASRRAADAVLRLIKDAN